MPDQNASALSSGLGTGPLSQRTSYQPATVVKALSNTVPPNNIEAEKLVLGALMLEKDALYQVSEIISPDCFYDARHRLIYNAIQMLALSEKPIDMQTVIEQLKLNGDLRATQGLSYVPQLAAIVNSTAHLEAHARLLYDKMIQRELISFGNQVIQNAYNEELSVVDTMQEAESRLFEITQGNNKDDVQSIRDLLPQTIADIQHAAGTDGLTGVPTGFPDIDRVTNGWQRSDLVVIGARPGMGKTAFLVSMARAMAVDFRVPIAIFSLEMSKSQMMTRLLVNQTEIPNENVKRHRLSAEQSKLLMASYGTLENAPIFIDETPGISIFDLRSKARRLVRTEGVRVIFIDYLQLMTAGGLLNKNSNREQEVSIISRSLKGLAKELNVTVIALAQVRRNERVKEGKEPQLSDLRESGAIEQDADMVCFIHRYDYYGMKNDQGGKNVEGNAMFIIAKHRNGPTETINLRFIKELIKFKSDFGFAGGASEVTVERGSKLNSKKGGSKMKFNDTDEDLSDPFMDAEDDDDAFRP